MKEVFLLLRGLSHPNGQSVNFHEFVMKPLMVMILCTAANENEDLLVTVLIFCCDYSLTFVLRPRAVSYHTHPRQKTNRGFKSYLNCFYSYLD